MHGLMWFYRLIRLHEKFPEFDSEEMFQVPTYRSCKSARKPIPKETYYTSWGNHFDEAKVRVSKLTSIWRHQGYYEMDDDGVAPDVRGRLAGHKEGNHKVETSAQRENYQTNYPLRAGVSRTGNDPNNLRHYCVARLGAYDSVTDEFLGLFAEVAELLAEKQRLQRKVAEVCAPNSSCLFADYTPPLHLITVVPNIYFPSNAVQEL